MVTSGPFKGTNYITVVMIISIMISPSLITSTTFLTSPQTVSQGTPKLHQWIRNGANKSKAILFHIVFNFYPPASIIPACPRLYCNTINLM